MDWLITLLVLLIVFAVLFYILDLLFLDARMKGIARAVLGLILVLYLLSALFGAAPFPSWPDSRHH